MRVMQITISTIVFFFVIGVIAYDSAFHFRRETVEIRRAHNASQKHWNLWYDPAFVYLDSPFRYLDDLDRMRDLIIPGYAVWSDLATSYYAAATLPVYVGNIHRHHGGQLLKGVNKFLQKQHLCFIEDQFHLEASRKFFNSHFKLSEKNGWPAFRYILLNKDKENSLLRRECVTLLSHRLEKGLLQISQLIYEGEYLNLYQLNSFDSAAL